MPEIDDTSYWESYYESRREPGPPSSFAHHVVDNYLQEDGSLVDLGCGNGRDAIFLASHAADVTAIDQCQNEIRYLQQTHGNARLRFVCGDFTLVDVPEAVAHLYSRFTIHAITRIGWEELLVRATKILQPSGYLFLEFRGLRNELYGKGQAVPEEPGAFIYEGHFRRFVDVDDMCFELRDAGFDIAEVVEESGFSPTPTTNETFARIVATRRPK